MQRILNKSLRDQHVHFGSPLGELCILISLTSLQLHIWKNRRLDSMVLRYLQVLNLPSSTLFTFFWKPLWKDSFSLASFPIALNIHVLKQRNGFCVYIFFHHLQLFVFGLSYGELVTKL
jgi:hypothetical protein